MRARTWSVLGNHTINDGRLDAIDDVVACAGYKVAISANLYILLFDTFQRQGAAASVGCESPVHFQRIPSGGFQSSLLYRRLEFWSTVNHGSSLSICFSFEC